jgi:Tfp pilus assembly protein FimT
MVLVLSLLVVVFALVVPRLMGSVASRRLLYSADEVRTAWAKARTMAMRTGEPHQFLYLPASRAYLLTSKPSTETSAADFQQAIFALSSVAHAVDNQEYQQLAEQLTHRGIQIERLPMAITFLDSATASRMSPSPLGSASDTNLNGGNGVNAVTFFPDGSASTSTVWLTNEDDEAIPISLRGMTGIATVGQSIVGLTGARERAR